MRRHGRARAGSAGDAELRLELVGSLPQRLQQRRGAAALLQDGGEIGPPSRPSETFSTMTSVILKTRRAFPPASRHGPAGRRMVVRSR